MSHVKYDFCILNNLDSSKRSRDKIIDDKSMYITADDDKQYNPFCKLKMLVEKFRHYKFITNQSQFK